YFVDQADHTVISGKIIFHFAGDHVVENANEGIDTVNTVVTFALPDNVEKLTLLAQGGAIDGTGNDLDNVITGNASDNTLHGQGGDDTLNGGSGNDTLIGDAGNDTLNGGGDADTMIGGSDNDTYFVDNPGDVVTELENDGFDTVNVGGSVVNY